jgi:prepilin-type N-terminal cleavage/methylation domain-containing protein
MNSRGFTLIEVLIVIAIIGTLTAIGAFQFAEYSRKSAIESQTRQMYTDIMEQRSKALFEKRNRGIRVSSTIFSIYSSATDAVPRTVIGNPFATITLKYPITSNNSTDIIFDTGGMLDTVSNQTICVSGTNSASIDSIVVSETRIRLGKLKVGTNCDTNNVNAK